MSAVTRTGGRWQVGTGSPTMVPAGRPTVSQNRRLANRTRCRDETLRATGLVLDARPGFLTPGFGMAGTHMRAALRSSAETCALAVLLGAVAERERISPGDVSSIHRVPR